MLQTGRIGGDAPADNIVASIIASLGGLSYPLALPLMHRFGRRTLFRGIVVLSIVMAILVGYFAAMEPFDKMHQKRLFILHSENVSFRVIHCVPFFCAKVECSHPSLRHLSCFRSLLMNTTSISPPRMALLDSSALLTTSSQSLVCLAQRPNFP